MYEFHNVPQIPTATSNIVNYLDEGVSPATTYFYRIYAYNSVGDSSFSNEVSATSPAINLPETGQVNCYNTSGVIVACAGTGKDGEYRKGITWPSPRFTNPDGATPITGNLVSDQLTGLMWMRDGSMPGPTTCAPVSIKAWPNVLNYVNCLNIFSYLGYNDWRMWTAPYELEGFEPIVRDS